MPGFNYDMINRYLNGEMNAEELNAFEEQLKEDADLQSEVALLKDVNETLKMKLHPDQTERALADTMQGLRGDYFKPAARIIPFRKIRWIMAAAAVFTALIILSIWRPWQQQDLYTQYAAIEMPGVAERGIPSDSLLKKATDSFNKNNFLNAISFFEEILKTDPQNSFVQFYYGIALLENQQIEKARSQFLQIYDGKSLFKNNAAFYIALSYLKVKDTFNTRQWLNKIPSGSAVYNKAMELLKKL